MANTMTAPVLSAQELHKSFTLHTQGGVRLSVLSGVSLSVASGEAVALTGPSGSGKSTLLRCLYGNYLPQSGRILVRHGRETIDIAGAEPRVILEVRRVTLGYVSQFLRAIPRIGTLDLVCEPLRMRGIAQEAAEARARDLLQRLRIPESLWPLPPATFSGGEQQRVNIARTLAAEYPILLVDEPTASLDADNRRTVIELLVEARERGAAIIGIFHDREAREAVCGREFQLTLREQAA